jgi:hypothetical protein
MEMLRNSSDAGERYREIQRRYWAKVEDRIRVYWHLSANERFDYLEATQPWVLELAAEEDQANYLGVEVVELRRLRREFV